VGHAGIGVRLREVSGNSNDEWLRSDLADQLRSSFNVRAAFYFYDEGGANALATPRAVLANAPDGTVMIGTALLAKERARWDACEQRATEESRRERNDPSKTFGVKILESAGRSSACAWWSEIRVFVVAHEFGHILQYKKGMKVDGPWQMEPHADFLAGWFLGRRKAGPLPNHFDPGLSSHIARKSFEKAVIGAFELGDTLFDDPDHHGSPELRASMVLAGYQSTHLSIDAAFDRGLKLLKLR